MSSQPSSSLLVIFIFILFGSADQTNITAEPGQNACLPCTSPDNKPALFVEWRRTDLGSEYVLRYRNKQINTENQHVSFRDRVDLLDRQMKDGNVSLALRNVTTDDRGAYKCRVVQTNSKIDTVFTINLNVETSPGDAGGGNRDGSDPVVLVVGVVVGLLVVVSLVVGIFVYFNRKKASRSSPKGNQPPVVPAEAQQPLSDQNQPDEQRVQSDLQDDPEPQQINFHPESLTDCFHRHQAEETETISCWAFTRTRTVTEPEPLQNLNRTRTVTEPEPQQNQNRYRTRTVTEPEPLLNLNRYRTVTEPI